MKPRTAITFMVLAAALGSGWHNHRQLASLRDARAKLVAQAAAKGFSLDPQDPEELSLPAKFPRVDRVAEAKRISAGFMAFAEEMKGLREDPDPDVLDEPTRQKIISQMDRVTALDGEQLGILITEIHAASGGSPEYRDLICYALHRLAEDHPGKALELLMKTPGMFEMVQYNGMRAVTLISKGLSRLSANDPAAALKWFRENRERLPAEEQSSASSTLVTAAAERDPRLALEMSDEFGIDPIHSLPLILTRSTPEKRTASLALLREWNAVKAGPGTGGEVFKAALKSLAFGLEHGPGDGRASFKESADWLDQAGLSPAEFKIVADNLQDHIHADDAGRWVEWLDRNLPPEVTRDRAGPVFETWVRKDPAAAERWLETAPASPGQERAVIAYARTMIRVDPENAIRWALTLPDAEKRGYVLRDIYRGWPRKDEDQGAKAAAEAFASEHGIRK